MKKKYKSPRVEIRDIEVEDIIATSPDDNRPGSGFDGGDIGIGEGNDLLR